MVKKLTQLYTEARRAIAAVEDVQTAGQMARELLCHITGKSRETLLADMEHYVSEDVCNQLDALVARCIQGEPMAYILGYWDFYGMTLHVNSHVLIPRDDTCAVTDLALTAAKQLGGAPRILDLCTGSGCIGLALAHKLENAKVALADISKETLAVAKKNVTEQKLSARVSCVQADALAGPTAFLGKFDLIVSNPPYITTEEMTQLPHSVKNYEPHLALHGGDDGLDFYRAIADKYRNALKPGGFLCFEFGMGQGDDVCRILDENGYTILERSRDYNERERAVIARYDRKED